jgi:hypothetical protein
MARKDLIIGGCTNYGINQLKPWVLSINEACKDENVEKVMCVGNASIETRDWLLMQGFTIVDMPQANIPVHVLRFVAIYEYLRKNYLKYRYVVTTDVKDVIFQYSPFQWLVNNLGSSQLVAGSESMRYKDEPWGNENLMQTYGGYIYDLFKDNKIYNVGTIGGDAEYVKDLVFNIFSNAVNRPIPIVDQAVYNVLINTQPYFDAIKFADQDDAWACQAGTTVDPSKIESFRPFLTEGEPQFKDGVVLTSKGDQFAIVHQYDRVPEWKEFVRVKYGQEDESQYFNYRT